MSGTTHAIVLAAGASRRLGRPKQLVPIAGVPLLRRVVLACLGSAVAQTHVVLGAHAEHFSPVLADLPAGVIMNPDWEEGMASSIRAALAQVLRAEPAPTAVMIVLADQWRLTSAVLDSVLRTAAAGTHGIVAAGYRGTLGPPVLFTPRYYPDLLALKGDEGARPLLRTFAGDVATVPMAEEWSDIDEPADLRSAGVT